MSSKNFENDSFNRRVVEKVAEYRDRLQRDEVSTWQQIFLDLSSEWELNCSDLRWQDLSKYYKRSLVLKLSHRRLTNDQGLIDRLQYPYLRKVYVVTIKFFEKHLSEGEYGRSRNNGEVEDNRLFIKYSMDGRYDPDVVAAFKRRSRKGKRIYVNINVADPAYNLPEDVKKLLLQIEHNRRERPHRHIEANRDERESSPVVLDGVAVAIEDGSPRAAEFSARDLLEKESFSVNTQEYDNIIKESLERELSPVPKRRRVESFESHCVEVWLESNEILSTSTSSSTAQGDPLHMTDRSGTQLLDLSKSVAVEDSASVMSIGPLSGTSNRHQDMETVRSQPPTLIMASQQNGTLPAVQADSSSEMIRIKQEPTEEIVKTVGNSVLSSSKSSGISMDVASEESFVTVTLKGPRCVHNESIISTRSQCSSKSIQSQQSVQKEQKVVEKECSGFEESALPPDFFRDHLTNGEVSRSTPIPEREQPRVVNESITSNRSHCSSKTMGAQSCAVQSQDSIRVKIEPAESKLVQPQESVRVKKEVVEADIPNFEECVLPSDFFCDYSSGSETEPTELAGGCCGRITPPKIHELSAVVQSQQSIRVKLEPAECDVMVAETSELPADFFISDTAAESVLDDEVGPENAAKIISRNTGELTIASKENVGSSEPHCIPPAANQLTRKRLSLLNESVSGISLFENSLESVPLHCIRKTRRVLRTLPVEQNVLLSTANDDEGELDKLLSNHHQSVCASESWDLSTEVDSMATSNDISDQLLQPVSNVLQNDSTEIIDEHPVQRYDINLHLESQSQNNQIYMRDLQNNNLPSVSVVEPGPENPSHTTDSIQSVNSSRQIVPADSGAILDQQDPPPKTATASNFQQRHETLQSTIESRLRFQVVLRSCWPELFSKTETFGDFYELLSILAVNLFPLLRPTDPDQIVALWPMFGALASQIAFGVCLQVGSLQSAKTAAVQQVERLGGSQQSDGDCCEVGNPKINGANSELDEELPQKVARREKNGRKRIPEEIIIEISEDSDPDDLPVRKKRQFRVRRQCPQNL